MFFFFRCEYFYFCVAGAAGITGGSGGVGGDGDGGNNDVADDGVYFCECLCFIFTFRFGAFILLCCISSFIAVAAPLLYVNAFE